MFPCIENKEHLVDFHYHTLILYHFATMQRVKNEKIISQIVGISEECYQNGDRVGVLEHQKLPKL